MTPWILLSLLGAVQAPAVPDLSRLAPARVTVDRSGREIVIELAPVHHLPAGTSHGGGTGHHHAPEPPVSLAVLPLGGAIYGFRIELLDGTGQVLPASLIHHVNLIHPDTRELFLPISRRVLAAGSETGAQRLPWLLFGVPIEKGERLIVSAALHNPTGRDFSQVRVRVVLQYTPSRRPWPVFRGYAFQLDVAFPVGDKSFDLPPGHSVRSYEGSPAVRGKIVAIGGHMHDHGVSIQLADAATGKVLWRATPTVDSTGHLVAIPVGRMYGLTRLGIPVTPDRRYRVTVEYENPTGGVLAGGGMGVVGGLFVPDGDVVWPSVDLGQDLYWKDLLHATRGAALVVSQTAAPAHTGHAGHADH